MQFHDVRVSSDHQLLIRQLASVARLDANDIRALAVLTLKVRDIRPRQDIAHEGMRLEECCVVLEGLAYRYKMVGRGRLQIVSLHLPGDLPDLQSIHLEYQDHFLGMLRPARVGFIAHADWRALISTRPNIASATTRHALIEAATYREWMTRIGRRNAIERTAHFLCEIYTRLTALGQAQAATMILPLTQNDYGDVLGLSTVHINRVLQDLRRRELIRTSGWRVQILDWPALQRIADFDARYLHLL